jgi:threonine 3-dehydrogenase
MSGFDIGLEMSGNSQAQSQLFNKMNNGGRVALLGIPPGECTVDWNQIIFKVLLLKGIYGREMFETWYKMAAMIRTGLDISPIITHRLSVDDFQQGFEIMNSGQSGKILLYWD